MDYKFCPICLAEYEKYPDKCGCGYIFSDKDSEAEARLFKIFKYTKDVYWGRIPYPKSEICINESQNMVYIEDIVGRKRGLEYIDCHNDEKPVIASEGLLFERYSTAALILNCDYISQRVFENCNLKILFLGKDVKGAKSGAITQYCNLKYIYVDAENSILEARNNVLIDKKNGKILLYPNGKTDEEYRADSDIESIDASVFDHQKHLKRLYVSKNAYLGADFGKNGIEVIRY